MERFLFRFRPRYYFVLAAIAFTTLWYEQSKTLKSQTRNNDLLQKPLRQLSLQECYERNQVTRYSVLSWISRDDWMSPPSLFNYGLPDHVFHLVNLDVGEFPIGHDLISFLGTHLQSHLSTQSRLNFLEIGVSVGKSLMTQLQFFGENALVMAFDVEDINPTFENMLSPGDHLMLDSFTDEKLVQGAKTLRRKSGSQRVDTIKQFFSPSGGELRYLSTDEFNILGWDHLQKQGIIFDLIYSDAFHEPSALLFEAEQLLTRGLVNLNAFAIVWDDCDGDMVNKGVCPILDKLKIKVGSNVLYSGVFKIGGWLGVHEELHSTCIMSTLPLYKIWQEDPFLLTRPLMQLSDACSRKDR